MADDLSEVWNPYQDMNGELRQKLAFLHHTTVLNDEQLRHAKDKAFESQIENLEYFNKHPEIRALIRVLFAEIVEVRPTDVLGFFRNFFNRGIDLLEQLISEQVKDFPVVESPRYKHTGKSSVGFIQPSMAVTNLGMVRSVSSHPGDRKQPPPSNLNTAHSVSIMLDSRQLVSSKSDTKSDDSITRILRF